MVGPHNDIDGRHITDEKVDISQSDMGKVYQHLGIDVPVLPPSNAKAQKRFIRTMPLAWVQQAAQLPGKALHVGIVLWYWAGITGSLTVALTRPRLKQFGLNHETGRRGLLALEHANLIRIERQERKSPRVTLLRTT